MNHYLTPDSHKYQYYYDEKLILAFCMLQGILLSLGAQDMHQNIAYADNNVRFTVISDGTLRLEYAPDGKFVDNNLLLR